MLTFIFCILVTQRFCRIDQITTAPTTFRLECPNNGVIRIRSARRDFPDDELCAIPEVSDLQLCEDTVQTLSLLRQQYGSSFREKIKFYLYLRYLFILRCEGRSSCTIDLTNFPTTCESPNGRAIEVNFHCRNIKPICK